MTRRTFFTIFIIGVALRIFWINVPPLWYDENFTLILARLPFDQMLKATAGDVHPPLWYLIEWTIYHIAPNLPAWFIRVPALIFSIATLPLFAKIMNQLSINSRMQSVAFLLMAIMPFQIYYANEGRMYAMLEFFVLLTFASALDRKYFLLFIGSLGLLYTQNYGPFYMAAIALVLAVRENIALGLFLGNLRKYNWAMAAMMSAGILWMPWFIVIKHQMTDIAGNYWITDSSIGAVLITIYKLFFIAAVPAQFSFASYAVTFAALTVGIIAVWKS